MALTDHRVVVSVRRRVHGLDRFTVTNTEGTLCFRPATPQPAWDREGARVAYTSSRAGGSNVWVQPADGSGEAQQMTDLGGRVDVDSWSPDGQVIAAHHHTGATTNILMIPVDAADREPRGFLERQSSDVGVVFSPDGRYVAYLSLETGQREVYIRPYPGPGGQEPVSVGGGREVVWAASGELFYRDLTGERMMAVPVTTEPTLTLGAPREVFQGRYYFDANGAPTPEYDVTADGQRFLMLKSAHDEGDAAQPQLVVVQNWHEELKRLVPVD